MATKPESPTQYIDRELEHAIGGLETAREDLARWDGVDCLDSITFAVACAGRAAKEIRAQRRKLLRAIARAEKECAA